MCYMLFILPGVKFVVLWTANSSRWDQGCPILNRTNWSTKPQAHRHQMLFDNDDKWIKLCLY